MACCDSLKADPRVSLIGSYVLGLGPQRHLMDRVRTEFRDRVVDPPTAEAGAAATGVGAAMAGMRPFVDLGTGSFSLPRLVADHQRGGDQLLHVERPHPGAGDVPSAARRARRRRRAAQPQPAIDDVQRAGAGDRRAVECGRRLRAGARRRSQSNNPTVIVSHAKLLGIEMEVPAERPVVPIGRADVKRNGRDVTIVANSLMTQYALAAAEKLAAEGIEAEVVDLRTLVPLDEKTILDSVGRTGRLVVVDESPLRCGIASEVSATVAEHGFGLLKAPVVRVTRAHVPVPYSGPVEAAITPDADKIAAAVRKVVGCGCAVRVAQEALPHRSVPWTEVARRPWRGERRWGTRALTPTRSQSQSSPVDNPRP